MKKKREYKKFAVSLINIWAISCISFSYILSWCGLDSNTDVTVQLIVVVIANTLTYLLVNAFEKNSRNKYRIDSEGNPFPDNTNDSGNPQI